jgi:hypothetical protein
MAKMPFTEDNPQIEAVPPDRTDQRKPLQRRCLRDCHRLLLAGGSHAACNHAPLDKADP